MLASHLIKKITTTQLLATQSCANTAAATSLGLDISGYEGFIRVTVNVGVITGTLDMKVVTSALSNLTSSTDVHTWAQVTTSNDVAVFTCDLECNALKQYIGFVGTIVTGPALLSVTVEGTPKYV